MKYSAWFIVDDEMVWCDRGHEILVSRVRRGIPRGAISFPSEAEATRELGFQVRKNAWPLFMPSARVERMEWS